MRVTDLFLKFLYVSVYYHVFGLIFIDYRCVCGIKWLSFKSSSDSYAIFCWRTGRSMYVVLFFRYSRKGRITIWCVRAWSGEFKFV